MAKHNIHINCIVINLKEYLDQNFIILKKKVGFLLNIFYYQTYMGPKKKIVQPLHLHIYTKRREGFPQIIPSKMVNWDNIYLSFLI